MSSQLNLQFKSLEEVEAYCLKNDKTMVILDDYVLDISSFQTHHPGGGALLRQKHLQGIDQEMKFHHPLTLKMANTMIVGSFKKQISRVIDPDRPFLPQIWNLNREEYMQIINHPHWLFVPSPPMFQSSFFQWFSHIQWWHIIFLPIIFIALLFWRIESWTATVPQMLLAAVSGFLIWTLMEYILHRFVFHSEKWLPDSKLIRYLHFVLHGVHHMLPNDPDRLVHPPVLLVMETAIVFPLITKFLPITDPALFAFFWSFLAIGYMTYDLMHYSLHHIDTSKHKGGWFHKLQKYHNQHHFGGEEAGFGVSSPLWDFIIGTTYKNKLK